MDKKEALKKIKSGDIYLEDVDKELRAPSKILWFTCFLQNTTL